MLLQCDSGLVSEDFSSSQGEKRQRLDVVAVKKIKKGNMYKIKQTNNITVNMRMAIQFNSSSIYSKG